MDIFNYDAVTGEFLSQSVARESPMEPGTFLIPANATTVAPAAPGANEAAVFSGGVWTLVPDHRNDGPYYDNTTGDVIQFALGDTPDVTMSTTFPQAIQDAIDEAARVSAIKAEAAARIKATIPALDSLDMIDLVVEIFKSIAPAAKSLTPEFQAASAIRSTAKSAILDGVTTVNDIVWP